MLIITSFSLLWLCTCYSYWHHKPSLKMRIKHGMNRVGLDENLSEEQLGPQVPFPPFCRQRLSCFLLQIMKFSCQEKLYQKSILHRSTRHSNGQGEIVEGESKETSKITAPHSVSSPIYFSKWWLENSSLKTLTTQKKRPFGILEFECLATE